MVGHHVQVPSGLTVDIMQTNVTGHTFASEEEVNLDNLYPALVQCFGIIFLGFIAGKFNFISVIEAKCLGTFIETFLSSCLNISFPVLAAELPVSELGLPLSHHLDQVLFVVLLDELFIHRPPVGLKSS